MSATPDLDCKKLADSDLELLEGLLADSEARVEGFGLIAGVAGLGEPWGVFVRGCLCGAAWLRLNPGGVPAEIAALRVSRRWSKIGLEALLLGRLARVAGEAGAPATLVRLTGGARNIGETLEEAGFSGPDPESDDYPAGEWNCRSGVSRPWD